MSSDESDEELGDDIEVDFDECEAKSSYESKNSFEGMEFESLFEEDEEEDDILWSEGNEKSVLSVACRGMLRLLVVNVMLFERFLFSILFSFKIDSLFYDWEKFSDLKDIIEFVSLLLVLSSNNDFICDSLAVKDLFLSESLFEISRFLII